MFAPTVLDVPTELWMKESEFLRASRKKLLSGAIELEIGGVTVRIASYTDATG